MRITKTGWPPLTVSDWRLLIAASLAQILTAFVLRTTSLPTLRRAAERLRSLVRLTLRAPEERVIWAIEASGRRLTGVSTCLVRAIVADLALASSEQPLRLTIGVNRACGGQVRSHAWVARGNRILVGGPAADEYVPLVTWSSPSA